MAVSKQEITQLILSGTDERTTLNEKKLSNYGISFTDDNIINRGSCTCNLVTPRHLEFLESKLQSVTNDYDWLDLINEIQNELKQEISGSTKTNYEVFFGPSGTDVVYFPLLFARERFPNKKILNIITCIEELGSGTINAGQGRYFAGINQFGEIIPKGEPIIDADYIETEYLSARCDNGTIENPKENLRKLITDHPDHSIIVSLVVGSKSGIEDNLSWIDELDADNVLWNVDMCQFRHSSELIETLTSKGVSVMITGSKFYQAPPFCGAILIPDRWIKRIDHIEKLKHFNAFDKVFSNYDLPTILRSKTNLPSIINKGGVLRWLVTINSIESLRSLDSERVESIISNWNTMINNELKKYDEFILMPDQEMTNPTIISFQVKSNGRLLDHQEMRKLFFSIIEDTHTGLPKTKFFIGQPVAYGDKSFLRLAIGANNIIDLNEGDAEFTTDKRIIAIIQEKLLAFENDQ